MLAILLGAIFNNSRISDLSARIGESNAALSTRITESKAALSSRLVESNTATKETLRAEMATGFARMERKLDEILRIVGKHEIRIADLEKKRG